MQLILLLMATQLEQLEAELQAAHADPVGSTLVEPVTEAVPQLSESESLFAAPLPPQGAALTTFERTRKIRERPPPIDLVLSLSSLYFRHIHPWIPFLDVQRVYSNMGSMDEPSLLYYALFGASLPFSFDSRLDQASSDAFWKYSKRKIFVDVLEEPSYNSLEVLTVLILDLSGMTHGPQVWSPLAVATKLAIQLRDTNGLVFRTSAGPGASLPLSKADRIFRQRLFWAIYSLDCYISITTNHISSMSDAHIHHFMPCRQQTWREDPSQGVEIALTPVFVFSHKLELLDLSRKVHMLGVDYMALQDDQESLNSWLDQFKRISIELSAWMHCLPSCLLWHDTIQKDLSNSVQSAFLMLHGYYHALVIYLNCLVAAPAHGALQSEAHSQTVRQSQDNCLRSIESLAQLITKSAAQVSDKLGWPFAWSVWVAARYVTIHRYTTGKFEPQMRTWFFLFLNLLDKMGAIWQISRKYTRLLNQAISELDKGIPTGQCGIIQPMTDLRFSTSHLEDLSRPDPMLHGMANQQEPTSIYESEDSMVLERSDDFSGAFLNDLCFDLPRQTSDNWFHMPLFPSSGYQQYHLSGAD